MKGLFVVLILALVTSDITPLYGLPIETLFAHIGRCKCLKHSLSAFGPRQLKSIQVIPQGMHCRRTEIILTLKNSWRVCVNPSAAWVERLLKELTKRK